MVMVLPAMVADAVAGGLFGGALGGPGGGAGWADRAAATNKSPVQTKKRFMVFLSVERNPGRECESRPDNCRTGRLPRETGQEKSGRQLSETRSPVPAS